MAIIVDNDTRLVVQGLTGSEGRFHGLRNRNYGTNVVACRIAPHHFHDVLRAVKEMARVARDRVVIEDNVFFDEASEEAERLRDPTHVRTYGADEWASFFDLAGLEVVDSRRFDRRVPLEPWLDRVETPADDRDRIKQLLAHRIDGDTVAMASLVIKGRKVQG